MSRRSSPTTSHARNRAARWRLLVLTGLALGACRRDTPPVLSAPDASAAVASVDAGASRPSAPWAVVLLSPATRAEAEAALAPLSASAARWVTAAPGYPRIVDSSTVPGFKPGYHVLLLGYCASKDDATRAVEWLRLEAKEAYTKDVAPGPESCPSLPGAASALAHPEVLADAVSLDGGVRLVAVTGDAHRELECRVRSTVVQLRRGAALLDEVAFPGECRGACTKKARAEGEETVRRVEAAIDRGEASPSELDYDFTGCRAYQATAVRHADFGPVLFVDVDESAPHDDVVSRLHVVGPGCGERLAHLRIELPSMGRAALGPAVTSKQAIDGFEIAAADLPKAPVALVSRDDAGCGWVLREYPDE